MEVAAWRQTGIPFTMMLRKPIRDEANGGSDERAGGRLTLLLSHGGWRELPAVEQLSRLLEPHGIRSVMAESGEEAAELIERIAIHIAVVDWGIPLRRSDVGGGGRAKAGGGRILELLRRLDEPPPTVIVRPPQAGTREHVRGLSDALRQGAFAVLDRPVGLERMLEVMRRVVRRHYSDHWPAA